MIVPDKLEPKHDGWRHALRDRFSPPPGSPAWWWQRAERSKLRSWARREQEGSLLPPKGRRLAVALAFAGWLVLGAAILGGLWLLGSKP